MVEDEDASVDDIDEGGRALVPYPITDEDDIAPQLARDAIRVARGELSDVTFAKKYRGVLDETEEGD